MTGKIKSRSPEKYEYAYLLYMQKVDQKQICKRVGVSEATIGAWKKGGNWEEKRAARTISLDDLMQKALVKISEMLDSNDFSADAFSKAVKQLRELKSSNTIDDDLNCFMSFQDYLIQQRGNYKELTDDFMKLISKYQDIYIQFRLGSGKVTGQ